MEIDLKEIGDDELIDELRERINRKFLTLEFLTDDELIDEVKLRDLEREPSLDEIDDEDLLSEMADRGLMPPDIEKGAEEAYYAMTGSEPPAVKDFIKGMAGKWI